MTRALEHSRTFLLLLGLFVSLGPGPLYARADPGTPSPGAGREERDGSHDFDFEFGKWTVQLSRRLNPLTGSTTWVEYEGTSVVRKVWGGRADGPAGHIEGLSLRLYRPETRQWSISWANSSDGALGPPLIDGFHDEIGAFYNQEVFNGRSIYVRFVFSDITPTSFRLEQAFSSDGG